MKLPGELTRNLLFTGKGGVGKTSVACATAVSLADAGKRVLLVSTDPASNLDEVLSYKTWNAFDSGRECSRSLRHECRSRRSREGIPRTRCRPLPRNSARHAVRSIEEQLSGACTVEIAAFDEFAKLLGDDNATTQFDHVIFDTAPTGHTLRLLQLPAAWSGFIETNVGGTSCLGPLSGLQAQHELYDNTVRGLCDSGKTAVYLVTDLKARRWRRLSVHVRNWRLLVCAISA